MKVARKRKELMQDNYTFQNSAATDKPSDLHWWENQLKAHKGNEHDLMNRFMTQ
jgi:hypothetical protein